MLQRCVLIMMLVIGQMASGLPVAAPASASTDQLESCCGGSCCCQPATCLCADDSPDRASQPPATNDTSRSLRLMLLAPAPAIGLVSQGAESAAPGRRVIDGVTLCATTASKRQSLIGVWTT